MSAIFATQMYTAQTIYMFPLAFYESKTKKTSEKKRRVI